MDIAAGSRSIVAALIVERFVDQFDFSALAPAERAAALREIRSITPILSGRNARLDHALHRFETGLATPRTAGRRNARQARRMSRLLRWLMPLAMGAATAGALTASPAYAYTAPAIGASVFNPLTQSNEKVVELIGNGYAVRTELNNVIFLATTIGDTYSAKDANNVTTSYTVTAVKTITYGTGPSAVTYVTGVTVKDSNNTSTNVAVVTAITTSPPTQPGGTGGTGSGAFTFTPPTGNDQYQDIQVGASGGAGSDGGGFPLCFPFVGCVTLGVDATAGGAGAPGPNFTSIVDSTYSGGLISNTADNLPGIKIASIGGNGGKGGNAYVGVPGATGGAGGNGGNVTGINYDTVSTGGVKSYGMWVFSQAGNAGAGGNSYGLSGAGGAGGAAGNGGSARGENYASITTQGDQAVGLLVQSLGGGGGDGGSGYGVVGSSGSGASGGNGGSATAYNAGTILTGGEFAHGVQAQSIGGSGGNSGAADGLGAFGASAGGAATGGSATVTLASSSSITTTGKYSHGAFAQSIGGGGGSTGWTGGVLSFGGSAGVGGIGGAATVNADPGARIETFNVGSYGIFAESVGGNGGTGGGSGGVLNIFTLGGSGGSGNSGGTVNVTSSATVITHAGDARGIFAQSVGGGGGNANISSGLVSIGGSGGTGANGGNVTVTLGAASVVSTFGKGADGVYVQSVGGGGGAGGASSGLVALGGSGTLGGNGGIVTASNAGAIYTDGAYSRGLFVQSVGGGGGSGGDAEGLAAVGGSGSVASNGGTVTATNSGSITTTKNMATAMQVQSIGGGGGDGGTTGGVLFTIGGTGGGGGLGGTVTANLSGSLSTGGNDSHGLLVQSVGGGGGNGGAATSTSLFAGLALGGNGAGGGDGGTVNANFTQSSRLVAGVPTLVDPLITTTGDRSRGIYLQSVGGGGGNGGLAASVTLGAFGAVSVAVGGSGSGGGKGGDVTANGDVIVSTSGANSEGYFAQSVGGGGGNGGGSVSVAASVGIGASASLSVAVGGSAGTGGTGGTVTVDTGGGIVTSGAYSTGLVAQSVGGGGGKGGFSIGIAGAASDDTAIAAALGIGGSGGQGGDGGIVTASYTGDITTGGQDRLGRDSVGALIQSVGGGGGSGGYNISAAISLAGGTAVGGTLGIGGSGAKGGNGLTTTGTVNGTITTYGARSAGVVIQSIGGGGGSGGFNVDGSVSVAGGTSANVGIGLGGKGDGGGSGGLVFGTVSGSVATYGAQSNGVVFQSVGGGGGTGGYNVTGSIGFGGSTGGSINIGLGGNGGSGGLAQKVTASFDGSVQTEGMSSTAIIAQSVGGGGGSGGFNVTGAITGGGNAGGSLNIGLGGSGGKAGNGGIVELTVNGGVQTKGLFSSGIVAQSVGGGGGTGGFNLAGGIGAGGETGLAGSFGMGGHGGGGGNAEAVTLKVNDGTTASDAKLVAAVTQRDGSSGIVAQSIGGGGGSGGFNVTGNASFAGTTSVSLGIGIGGSGGNGGSALNASADISGMVMTWGRDSVGVLTQSIGGGGGNGGFNIEGSLSASGSGAGSVNIGVGGSGGGGGQAGDATLRINDQVAVPGQDLIAVLTRGARSAGIVTQSIGGGGGNGGFNVTAGINIGASGALGANVGVGGFGGDGKSAGKATADITGTVVTTELQSDGIVVQSIGGGGGSGGFNVTGSISVGKFSGAVGVGIGGFGGKGGNAGDARLDLNQRTDDAGNTLLAVSTGSSESSGIIVQSLGGGGGNGGFNVQGAISFSEKGSGNLGIGVGGFGGDGGSAGIVTANIRGDVRTNNSLSGAVLIQSLGGGGGNGGFNVTAGITGSEGTSGNVGIGVGGFGGAAGDGKQVTANIESDIQTRGTQSNGIDIQSLGGGGGNGGFDVTGGIAIGTKDSFAGNFGVGIGGFGGSGGSGGVVEATVTGNIKTGFDNSHALLVQSLGGGGGNGGFNVTGSIAATKGSTGSLGVGIGGFGGTGGAAEMVTATMTGDITTRGDNSYGVTFQSLGGGGGNGAFNVTAGINLSAEKGTSGNVNVGIGGFGGTGGQAGDVTGTVTGDIVTGGKSAHGVLLQSLGGGGGNGGMNIAGGVSLSKGATGSLGIGIGGFGGGAGDGGIVKGTLTGNVQTRGDGSYGAILQSLGGSGGNGAMNITGAVTLNKGDSTSGSVAVGIGGFAGGGGVGKDVQADVIGFYTTDGKVSPGVVAISLGGGGGAGGINVSGTIGFSTEGTAFGVSLGLGGFGGDGGSAGKVTLVRMGQTLTRQQSSDGVFAGSIGGGGGRGAMNISAGITGTNKGKAGTIAIGIGGFGGTGGNSGIVNATVTDSVWALGSDGPTLFVPDEITFDNGQPIDFGVKTHLLNGSNGIVVKSQAGGGGSGGMNISAGISLAKADNSTASALVLGIGGFGGSGGDAQDVTANIGAQSGPRIQVQGTGDTKSAVYVASVGGGGGDGAINISGGITSDGQITAGFGGAGGGGGLGRIVVANVNADLFATGYKSSGLTVQSIGGGGGNGGINISGGLKPMSGKQPVIAIGMGGDGGAGNSSEKVTVNQDGQVIVSGFSSNGVLVQSVAGGGGAGGMDIVASVNKSTGDSKVDGFGAGIGIGGTGGSGGTAGDVFLRSTGTVLINTVVTITGDTTTLSAGAEAGMSSGIAVQSIGGGGGVGGFNFVGVAAPNGTPFSFAMGGTGGVGGDAGNVTVQRGYLADQTVSKSLINTFGVGSNGLVAQSIGGGGGNAGSNVAFTLSTVGANKTGYGGQFTVGGDGGSSGDGKVVTVTHAGDIQTDGFASNGILAQSIGKGGGNAAVNFAFAYIKTAKDAQDTAKTNSISLTLGGAPGDGGSAGNVTVFHDGAIRTHQAESNGVVAQSLAGGGGNAAMNMGGMQGAQNSLDIGIGRMGGLGGIAGIVTVRTAGSIVVEGEHSNGIVAQSVGGAGGQSGSIDIDVGTKSGSGANATEYKGSVSVGLDGADGGHSETVTVTNLAQIVTNGESARGIVAQSIGGDGGIGGSASTKSEGSSNSLAVAIGGGGGNGATSSKVTVGNSGTIVTQQASSDGILAQSIGGGGGVGGSALTRKIGSADTQDQSIGTIAVVVGGSGGAGAIAGNVEVTNDGIISTTGAKSYGIRAQSIGGGGGVGGAATNVELQKTQRVDTLNVLIGGGGGDGQLGGRVDVINRGLIQTTGDEASGISANSVGGGGGDAGSVYNLTVQAAKSSGASNALQVAIGGGGGIGGMGGTVHVVNMPTASADSGTIITTGLRAHGIFAQSLGGGGGNGSSIYSLSGSTGNKDSISVGINLGGAGGSGNTGGEVIVENSGFIHTTNDGSDGILAQSIGGGGGNGGVVLSGNILLKSKDKSPLISIGGTGGDGNDGGHVTVNNSGTIYTEGKRADGIVAQSVGGGGGNAGLAFGLTADVKTFVGSNLMALLVGTTGGGKSGIGGQVDVVHSGNIVVTGEGSQAIVAESINGGGGHAYFDMSGFSMPTLSALFPGITIPDLGSLNGIPNLNPGAATNTPVDPVIIAARVGADGAVSMNANQVNVTITGTVGTTGSFSSGSTIRSIGGGGGEIVLSGDLVKPAPPPPGSFMAKAIYVVGLGAKNTTDSSGTGIDSKHTGQIVTEGLGSTGMVLQSIGGGGGSAVVNLQVEDSTIIDSVRFGLGAVNTSGSNGGTITRTQSGGVFTTNDYAAGALVQSIGGGGGYAVSHVTLIPTPVAAAALASTTQVTGSSAQRAQVYGSPQLAAAAGGGAQTPVVISLGADGGGPNNGGIVDLTFNGGFTTQGNRSGGIIAQSIGAGGGEGMIVLDGTAPVTVILGGQNGASGNGGTVTVTNNGSVFTSGIASDGLLLQSIGGGGGALYGAGTSPQLILSNANSGDGAAVTLNQTGNVSVLGDGANGIIAQSLGGGGGYIEGVFAGTSGGSGSGGTVDLTITGSVFAPGANSSAIMAQSLGSTGADDITVAATGDVRGGSGTGVGIGLDGGVDNLVTVGTSLSAVSGMAMTGTSGNDRLENHGLVVGNLVLGSGTNVAHNALGASFLTINTLDLQSGAGSTGLFSNDGTLLMGLGADRVPVDLLHGQPYPAPVITDPKTALLYGTSVISIVALDGDFRQSASGLMKYDVAFGPYVSDRINATGSAQVAGTADITLTWLENRNDVTLIATGAGGTDNGLNPIDTLAIDYGIKANSAGIHLTVDSHFALPFLNANEQQMGHHLDSALDVGGGSGIGRLMALIGNLRAGQEDTYKSIFAELDPESLLTPAVEQVDAARAFGSGIFDCQAVDQRGAKCAYARIDVHGLQGRGGVTDVDLKTSARLRFGGAISAGDGWRLGAAGGLDDMGRFDAGMGRMEGTKGLGVHLGLGVAKRFASDRAEARFAISGGLQSMDTSRNQFIFTRGLGKTTIKTGYFGTTAGLDYTLSVGDFFAKPAIDLQAMRMQIRHFAEEGLDGTGARSRGASSWYLSATPMLTAGIMSGQLRLSGTVGYQFSNKSGIVAPIQLVGAPDASDPAIIVTPIDKNMLVLGAGVEIRRDENFELQFGFKGLYGDRYHSTSANAKLVFRF